MYMKITMFWDVTPCSLVGICNVLGEPDVPIICAEDTGNKFPCDVGNILSHYVVSYPRSKFVRPSIFFSNWRWRIFHTQISSYFSSSSSSSSSSVANLSLITGFLYQQFEVSIVITVRTTVFWNVMSCSLLDVYQSSTLMMEAAVSSEIPVHFHKTTHDLYPKGSNFYGFCTVMLVHHHPVKYIDMLLKAK